MRRYFEAVLREVTQRRRVAEQDTERCSLQRQALWSQRDFVKIFPLTHPSGSVPPRLCVTLRSIALPSFDLRLRQRRHMLTATFVLFATFCKIQFQADGTFRLLTVPPSDIVLPIAQRAPVVITPAGPNTVAFDHLRASALRRLSIAPWVRHFPSSGPSHLVGLSAPPTPQADGGGTGSVRSAFHPAGSACPAPAGCNFPTLSAP